MRIQSIKRAGVIGVGLLLSLSMTACSSGNTEAGGATTFRLTQTNPSTTVAGQASEEFAAMVEEKTDGRYKVEVYHDGQLGDERDSVEATQLGNVDFALVNASVLVNFAPELAVFDLPYVIQSTDHADKVFMGEIGDEAEAWVADIGVHPMGFWESGFRNLTNSKRPVNSVADVQGLRIRVMENEVHQQLWLALGADPVPMAWGEAYTGLQQGALDGQENPTSVILANNVQEVNKNLAMTEHIYSLIVPIMNQQAWDALSEQDQAIFQEIFDEMMTREREICRERNDASVTELEADGMQVTYPDKTDFIEATRSVREDKGKEYADVLSRIEALA